MSADDHLRPPGQQHRRQPLVEVVRLSLIDEWKDLRSAEGRIEWDLSCDSSFQPITFVQTKHAILLDKISEGRHIRGTTSLTQDLA